MCSSWCTLWVTLWHRDCVGVHFALTDIDSFWQLPARHMDDIACTVHIYSISKWRCIYKFLRHSWRQSSHSSGSSYGLLSPLRPAYWYSSWSCLLLRVSAFALQARGFTPARTIHEINIIRGQLRYEQKKRRKKAAWLQRQEGNRCRPHDNFCPFETTQQDRIVDDA